MLYLVATPIGNLGDISQRALDTLRAVDFIASEDTRHTGQLLKRFGIEKPQLSFHEHNEARAGGKLVDLLTQGRSIALCSDAGTPGISDPGFTIVRRCIEEGIAFTMIPGPSAFVMALVLSGLPTHAFTFRGFPPRKPGQRRKFLAVDAASPHTLVFYESPYRIGALLDDALAVYGDRRACLANDLTKMFERIDRGLLSELRAQLGNNAGKGEFVLVLDGAGDARAAADDEGDVDDGSGDVNDGAVSAPAEEAP
jgi:16S rRNA (cytidine1402-2'-O)-methyltransferase